MENIDFEELDDMDIPEFILPDETAQITESADIGTQDLINETLKIASEYIGINRTNNLPQIAKFLGIFGLTPKMDGKWVPFCASGLSYSLAKAYCNLANIQYTADNSVQVFRSVLPALKNKWFMPSPSCWQIEADAQKRGTYEKNTHKPDGLTAGEFVLYNWGTGTTPQHIGLLNSADTNGIHTTEFNTSITNDSNGGAVAKRDRSYDHVLGFVRLK